MPVLICFKAILNSVSASCLISVISGSVTTDRFFFLTMDFIFHPFFLLCLIIFDWMHGHNECNIVEYLNVVFLQRALIFVLTEI